MMSGARPSRPVLSTGVMMRDRVRLAVGTSLISPSSCRARSAPAHWRLCQLPPRRVRMPRTGLSAWVLTVARRASARRRLAAPLVLPSLTPRGRAATRASLVRREIAPRSAFATSASYSDGQVVYLRHVAGQERHPAVAPRQQEGRIAREPVQPGNHQRGAGDLRQVQRPDQFGTIDSTAARPA